MEIFVGCSTQALVYRDRIELALNGLGHDLIQWEKIFVAGNTPLSDLEHAFQRKADAGIFIVAADDLILADDNKKIKIARDNVWLELGLMAGQKGIKSVAVCITEKDIHMPSDYRGLTWINISNNDTQAIRAALCAWLDCVPKRLRVMPNVYLSSRDDVENIRGGKNYFYQIVKKVSRIRLLNFAGTSIFTPHYADHYHKRTDMGGVLFDFIRLALENGAHVDVITNAPTECIREDIKGKITTDKLEREYCDLILYDTFFAMEELLSNDNVFAKAAAEDPPRFCYGVTNIVLPHALFQIEFETKYKDETLIKVDLYSPELRTEIARRSMIIYQSSDCENYKFFSETLEAVFRSRWNKIQVDEQREIWRSGWKKLEKLRGIYYGK